jgi:hypothetical protein
MFEVPLPPDEVDLNDCILVSCLSGFCLLVDSKSQQQLIFIDDNYNLTRSLYSSDWYFV